VSLYVCGEYLLGNILLRGRDADSSDESPGYGAVA